MPETGLLGVRLFAKGAAALITSAIDVADRACDDLEMMGRVVSDQRSALARVQRLASELTTEMLKRIDDAEAKL